MYFDFPKERENAWKPTLITQIIIFVPSNNLKYY